MCGISAIYSYHSESPPVDSGVLRNIRDAMLSRGPDDAGLWISDDHTVGLAHRRLSIIDLSEQGRQPLTAKKGQYRIVFNGEIYNYQSLRKQLQSKGYQFATQTDTEVLLNLYVEYGPRMLHHLRGMFAFAIWDDIEKSLFLARDPFGIKPLYYSDNGHQIVVASQVKALLKSDNIDLAVEPAGHVGFFLLGHVPEPYTLYKGIRALPAGHALWIDKSGVSEPKVYFDIRKELLLTQQRVNKFSQSESFEQLKENLKESMCSHLVADVPVGVFLSAGIDSALVTALTNEQSTSPLQTVTLGFDEYRNSMNDEVPMAEQLARQYSCQHQTYYLKEEDIAANMPHFFSAMDQPTIDGINTYFVSKVTAGQGLKVALSGVGGDELLGGYNNFQRIPQFVRWCAWAKRMGVLSRLLRRTTQPMLRYLGKEKYAGFLEYAHTYSGAYFLLRSLQMPFQIFNVMDAETFMQGWRELALIENMQSSVSGLNEKHLQVSGLELQWYMRNQLLRDTDWAGMAHSLEIRVPYVDVPLFRQAMQMHVHIQSKRDCVRRLKTNLPADLLNRKKSGFNVPIRDWQLQTKGNNRKKTTMQSWADLVYSKYLGE